MSKSSAIPVQNLPSPLVPEAVNEKDLDNLPQNNVPLISTYQRKRILENRLHFLYERYRDRLSVTNAMRQYQEYRHRRLTAAAATSLGLIGVNEMSRIFMRSPLFRYSLKNPVPLVLTAAVPYLLANESSTNFLERHTSNLWRIHKSRVNQKLPDQTYEPSGYYGDKMVDFAWENPYELVQISFQELLTGHKHEPHWQNMFSRSNKDIEDYPYDLRQTAKEMKVEIDVPERLKRFEVSDSHVHASMSAEDPLNQENEDEFFDQTGQDMCPQYNDELPAVDHGFDEEAFIDLPINTLNQPLVANTYLDPTPFTGRDHAPLWIQKLIPLPFRKPKAYESLAHNWRQKLGLERLKKQHAQQMRDGKKNLNAMQLQIQKYAQKCKEEDYLRSIKDIKMRPRDAKSTVSNRALITLGNEDNKKFYEYEKFLANLHQQWKREPNMTHGRGQAVQHVPGTYINEKGTWIHELEGTAFDIKGVNEEVWRNHYEEMIDIQSRYDLINNIFAYDEDLPERTETHQRDFNNMGGIYENGFDHELEQIDVQKLKREGRLEQLKEVTGENIEDQEEAEEQREAFNIVYQPEEMVRKDLAQNLEAVSPVLYPEYYGGPFLKNKSLLRLGSPILKELMLMELDDQKTNPEFITKLLLEELPDLKAMHVNLEGEFKRTYENYEPTEGFESIEDPDEYVEAMVNNRATMLASDSLYGRDLILKDIAFPPKEPGEEEEEEGEGEEGEEEEEDEDDPFEPMPEELLPKIEKEEHHLGFTLNLLKEAHHYEYLPESKRASLFYLLGLKEDYEVTNQITYTERNKEGYRYVDDVIDAYQPWNRDHLDLILDSLPKHVFLDIKKPLKFNKRLYETNPYNPFRGKVYEDFWGFLRYDDYRAEMINKRNIAPQISFWRRDY